jgi:hypothetical protein
MRFLVGIIIAAIYMASFGAACSRLSPEKQVAQTASDTTTIASRFVSDTIPAGADTITVGFRDLNYFTSNDHFCIVGIVDNPSNAWQKIWLRAYLKDSTGNIVLINGDSSVIVRAFSDAVPPRGATAFFVAVPRGQISGIPVGCTMEGAGAVRRPSGAILLTSEIGGVRVLYQDPADTSKMKETVFNLQATLENPLDMNAYHPRIVLLVYGKDEKLYFTQVVNPDKRSSPIRQERDGPLAPGEKRKFTCPIYYEMLPEQLQNSLIGRVAVQAFDAR